MRIKSARSIQEVVREGLCVGCGTCLSLCPTDAIRMLKDSEKGVYTAVLEQDKCNQCGVCAEVCPGRFVDHRRLNLAVFGKQPKNALLGNFVACYTGHATDHAIRYNSASGGLVTALLAFALDRGIVDGALVTTMDEQKPLEPRIIIARTAEEVISACGSKYCPVPANIGLKNVLTGEGRFAVVGLPCHINGIRKAALIDRRVRDRIVLHLGIFCGLSYSFLATEFLLRQMDIRQEAVRRIDYRGGGWPGRMSIRLRDDSTRYLSYPEYARGGFRDRTRECCSRCNEYTCEFSDISFGDAWNLTEVAGDHLGSSLIICRTKNGQRILQSTESGNRVQLNRVDADRVLEAHSGHLTRKVAARGTGVNGLSRLARTRRWLSSFYRGGTQA